MMRLLKRFSRKAGLPPGTLVPIGEERTEKVRITVIDYDEASFSEVDVEKVEDCFPFKETPTVSWINVDGVHDVAIVEKLGSHFGLHPLVMEDIVNTGQRPKLEDLEGLLFIVVKMLYRDEEKNETVAEQVSMLLGENFVISFQERPGDVFGQVRSRLKESKGRIRKMGADYLAYALIDAVVDGYFGVLEALSERMERLEDEILDTPGPRTLHDIQGMRGEMVHLRKSVWPLREVAGALTRGESKLVREDTFAYLRDVHDHTIRVIETIESMRDMVSGMRDTYLSSLSNRMNEVMKVLTIIATIFIPITFVAGVYGMNFEYIPELKWHGSYFVVWGVMLAVTAGMLIYFRRKDWI